MSDNYYRPECYKHIWGISVPHKPGSYDFKYHPLPGELLVTVDEHNGKKPQTIILGPSKTQSEPATPIYSTHSGPHEAPDEWFLPITSKERVAVMTFESIPVYLEDLNNNRTTSTLDCFSPSLLSLVERMKFHFSRAMARARYEADFGKFDCDDGSNEGDRLLPSEVMSSMEVELFLAGVEEVYVSEDNKRVIYRRYWRFLKAPAGFDDRLGGVISAGSMMKHHQKQGVRRSMEKLWDETPKALVAEFLVGADGFAIAGRVLEPSKRRV